VDVKKKRKKKKGKREKKYSESEYVVCIFYEYIFLS